MVNLPVILLTRGTRVGTVRDLVIDLDRRVVAALLLVEPD
jgi:sporulation protein YlmC with PRC-barrel domain